MRLLVLAALAAVAVADVSELTGFNRPPTSYGVPQNSVTENFLHATPTSPSPGLHLPAFEHQDFNAGSIVSSTPSPIDAGIVSSTPAPTVGPIVSTTAAPNIFGLGSGYSYTTPAPSLSFNSGELGLQGFGGLPSFASSFVSSTPAPNVVLTSGSQELLTPQIHNSGLNLYSTPAPSLFSTTSPNIFSTTSPSIFSTTSPSIFSTPAPLVSSTPAPLLNSGLSFGSTTPAPLLNSGFSFGSGLSSFPSFNFGLNTYSTPLPIGLGGVGSYNVHSSGGSLTDSFGLSTPAPLPSLPNQDFEVSKHVYFYAAPEDPEPARTRVNIAPVPPPKKNVKIVFIKAPSPPAPAPIRIAAPPQNEEKTVVYVLVKKPEEQQDIELLPPPSTQPSKPEVYFIKYKSQQEAEQAISQVQNAQSAAVGPEVIANTVPGGDILGTINHESAVTPLPFINYVSSTTTPAPSLGIVGGPISGYVGAGFDSAFVRPQLDNADISSNLISPTLFSTGAPVSVSTGEADLFGSTTVSPIPHVTYGPPILKKK